MKKIFIAITLLFGLKSIGVCADDVAKRDANFTPVLLAIDDNGDIKQVAVDSAGKLKVDIDTNSVLNVSSITITGSEFSVGGSTFVVTGGKVGIGTNSPNYTLDISGNVNASAYYGDGSNLTGIKYTLIYSTTLAADATNIDISGLSGNSFQLVMIGSAPVFGRGSIYFNANYTDTNYYRQYIYATGTSVAGEQANNAIFYWNGAGDTGAVVAFIQNLPNLQTYVNCLYSRSYNNLEILNNAVIYRGFISEITDIRIGGSAVDYFGEGTKVWLYQLKES